MRPTPKRRALLPVRSTRLAEGGDSCSLVDEAVTNERAWRRARWLIAGDKRYEVVTNPPTVMNVSQACPRFVFHFSIPAVPEREADRRTPCLPALRSAPAFVSGLLPTWVLCSSNSPTNLPVCGSGSPGHLKVAHSHLSVEKRSRSVDRHVVDEVGSRHREGLHSGTARRGSFTGSRVHAGGPRRRRSRRRSVCPRRVAFRRTGFVSSSLGTDARVVRRQVPWLPEGRRRPETADTS